MSLRAYRTFQALILAGLGVYLLAKVMDGRILFYINQRFVFLVLLAALALLFLGQLLLRERPAPPKDLSALEMTLQPEEWGAGASLGWKLWLVALPLFIGILVPEQAIGASALRTRGVNTSAGLLAGRGSSDPAQIPAEQRSILDWLTITESATDYQPFSGQSADVTGFIYHDPRLAENQVLVGRFTITCCVADAVAIGMVVNWRQAEGLAENQWVRVRGAVRFEAVDGKVHPVIDASQVDQIPSPEQPYLFP
jgi:uncharacterized repeat protein (TIGR03943 family)